MLFFRRSPEYDPLGEISWGLRLQIWTSGWRGPVTLGVLIITLALTWNAPAIYRELKTQRAQKLIADSEDAWFKGDLKGESEKLTQAVALLQQDAITLRAVARHQVRRQQLGAVDTYARLLKTGKATADDKVEYARVAHRLGRDEQVAGLIEELEKDQRSSGAMCALRAEQLAGNGRWQEALDLARRDHGPDASGDHSSYASLVLARLLLMAPGLQMAERTEAVALLGALAGREDEQGREALELLIELSQNEQTSALLANSKDVDGWMTAAEKAAGPDMTRRVRAWSLRLAADPARRKEITHEFFERFRNDGDSRLRLEAAKWLNQHGGQVLAMEMAEASKFESQGWLLLYLDSIAAQGDWKKVLSTLETEEPNLPLCAALKQLFALQVSLKLGSRPDLGEAWREIRQSSRLEDTKTQLYIAGYAEQIGFPAEATAIYRRLLQLEQNRGDTIDPFGRSQRQACYVGVLRTAGGSMSLKELTSLVGDFAGEFPEIDDVQNDSAYLQLLLGQATESVEAIVHKLVHKKPQLLAYRTTAALCALRRNDVKAAAAIYDGWAIDWRTAQDRFKAVYVAVMRSAGRIGDSERVMAAIEPKSLRPEERQLAGIR
jgi:hypothetical protein